MAESGTIRDDAGGYCPACGYNLSRLAGPPWTCPECGKQTMERLPEPPQPRINRAQWTLACFIAALACYVFLHRLLVSNNLYQASIMFIGLPTVLAVALTLAPRAKSATGMIAKGITIALLVSGVFLEEGIICILMMSPLFYAVGALIGLGADLSRAQAKQMRRNGRRLSVLVLAVCLASSVEGLSPKLSFPRGNSVTVESVVAGTPAEVEASLASRPRFTTPLPLYLQLGFPKPGHTFGEGLGVGDVRVIHFTGGEGWPGDLTLRVAERRDGYVRWSTRSDTSHIRTWLDWGDSEVEWERVDAGHTRVRWTLHYRRNLDPAWYFGPWQRYAVGLAAQHLVDNLAAPRRGGE